MILKRLQPEEWDELSELIFHSINSWYTQNLNRPPMDTTPLSMRFFPEIYESLDPGCCITACHPDSGKLLGACFYHLRETHLSLGIMAVHPDFGGRGVAKTILNEIISIAEQADLPVRLVSSAMNLDSFSLYTKAGFVPCQTFQDLSISVPKTGFPFPAHSKHIHTRPALLSDLPDIVALEKELVGISREKDYYHFITNKEGIWHMSVSESPEGKLNGFLVSVNHPNIQMLGPGVARNEDTIIALAHTELDTAQRGRTVVFLLPVHAAHAVQTAYSWGARNVELHVTQVRGHCPPVTGFVIPTFMPETG